MQENHEREVQHMRAQVEKHKDMMHEEKQKRRRAVQNTEDIKAECQNHIKEMQLWLYDTESELKVSCN